MPVFALYNFDEAGTPALDSALDNGAQNGKYINGATPIGGEAVLDGVNDFVKIFADPSFQMEQGTLDISFTQTAHMGTGNNTILSRDSVGETAGGYRIDATADGAIQIVHETDGGAETFGTPDGFMTPGDKIHLSYSWDADGTGGQLVIENTTTGETFDAPVPPGLTMDQGDNSQPWMIGAGQNESDPDVLNNVGPYFNGTVETFSLSDTCDNINGDPDANPDEAVTDEDTPVTVDVLLNDTDPQGQPLDVTDATAEHGTVVINDDGTVTYTPDGDYNGPDTITYTVTDPDGNTSSSTVAVTVNPVNDDPVAVDDTGETAEDTPVVIDVLGNDTDADGDVLALNGTPTSADGTVEVNNDGTITFTPNDGFNGEATITYEVTDGNGGTDTGTVTVTVGSTNDDPVAVDDVAETDEDTPITIDVLGNDTDPDGDPLTISGTPTSEQGAVVVNDDGTLTFTPTENFNGEATITYDVSDGNGGTDTATVTVTVNPVNDDPVTAPDQAATLMDMPVTIDVLANDTDPDGDTLSIVGVPTSTDGTVTLTDDGQVIFTPNVGFLGEATINYTVTDSNGGTADGVAIVTVSQDPDTTRDGIVYGTTAGDLIDGDYAGDPDGDFVDREDAIIQPDAPNDDRIYAGGGSDTIFANLGDDSVRAQGGDDSVYGGVGDDSLAGGRGDDTLRGDAGADSLRGMGGDDSLVGGIGSDTLAGGDGDDTLTGNIGNDSVRGMDGDDVIDTGSALPRPDIDFPGVPGFPGYPADTDPNDDRDTVFGGFGDDSIRTGDDADSIKAGYGDDTVDAGVDNDTVYAMLGEDSVIGGEGSDLIYAGQGNDIVYGGLTPQFDGLNIPDGTDPRPNNGMDTIYGGLGNDTIFGQDDNDFIKGGLGKDLINGGIDNDTIFGGMGNDTIIGGQGADSLVGGGDRDVFLGANANDTIDGFENGNDFDTLDLSGSGPLRIVYADDNPENGTVTFLDANGNPTGTMSFTNIENVIPCFTPGTLIATPRGEVPVESLRAGDKIVTRDNGIQDIAWTGSKTLKWADLNANPHLQPVLVRQGSLGNGLPERDMMVSPNHRLLVANDRTALYFDEHEVLVAAKHLVGSKGVHTLDSMGTTYIHFMFAQHEVVLSNGAWTESFQPGDYTLKGMGNAQRSEILELFPDLKTVEGLADYTAARRTLKRHEARLLVR